MKLLPRPLRARLRARRLGPSWRFRLAVRHATRSEIGGLVAAAERAVALLHELRLDRDHDRAEVEALFVELGLER